MASYDGLSSLRALVTSFDPQNAWRDAQGMVAETIPHWTITAGQAPVSGTLYAAQIYLQAGKTLTTCHVASGAVAVSETFARLGLYDTAGNLLASCADQTTGWGATVGLKSQALTAAYTPPATGIYYSAFLILAGTCPALGLNMAPAATRVGLTEAVAGKPLYLASTASLSDLPNPMTVAAGTAPGVYWMAFS